MIDFWKPLKPIKPKKKVKVPIKMKPFDLRIKPKKNSVKRKDMNWSQAKRRYPNMKGWNDTDKDGVINSLDCKPLNKRQQGFMHTVNPRSKRSMRKFERYKPQVQTITTRMEKDFITGKERIERGIREAEMSGGKKHMRLKVAPLIYKRQEEDVGFFDYASIPGIKQNVGIKEATMAQPVQLLIDKGIVKGIVYKRKTSNPRVPELKNLYVNPEYRRQGLGKRAVTSVLRNPKVDRVVGVVIPGAKKKWEKMGAKTQGSYEEYEALGKHLNESAKSMYGVEYEKLPEPLQQEVEMVVADNATPITLEKKDITPTLYHGTTKERAKRIMEEGLKSGKGEGSSSGIFLASGKRAAQTYAYYKSGMADDEGTVLKVRLPKDEFDKYKEQDRWETIEEISVGKNIPPERIEVDGPREPAPEVLQEIEEEIEEYEKE